MHDKFILIGFKKKRKPVVCGSTLIVRRNGGELEYHCPSCDVRKGHGLPMAMWINGNPPDDRKCKKIRMSGRAV